MKNRTTTNSTTTLAAREALAESLEVLGKQVLGEVTAGFVSETLQRCREVAMRLPEDFPIWQWACQQIVDNDARANHK